MVKKQNCTGSILRVDRLNNSVYGNPRFIVVFHDYTTDSVILGKTAANSMFNYNMPGFGIECTCTWHTTKNGNIIFDYIGKADNLISI